MSELELIPTGFGLCWIAYYVRAIVRAHRSHAQKERGSTFTETWLRFWLSPAVLKDSFRCTLISVGAFLGIEIARGDSVEKDVKEDSEIDHF
jgi:hypothetical protein